MRIIKALYSCNVFMEVTCRKALITGGALGIGLEIARQLLKNGLKKLALTDVSEKEGLEAVCELEQLFGDGKVFFTRVDVTKPKELSDVFCRSVEAFGGLDIVVNNAGILNDAKWQQTIDINIKGTICGTHLAFEHMGKNNGGCGGVVINLSSILGTQPLAGCPVYVATKHAIIGLTRSYGMPFHYERTGVRVCAMCPGVTFTPLISAVNNKPNPTCMDIEAARELADLPKQRVDCVGCGVVQMIRKAESGSIWISEGGEPIYELCFPHRTDMKREDPPEC